MLHQEGAGATRPPVMRTCAARRSLPTAASCQAPPLQPPLPRPLCSVTPENVDMVKRRWVDAGRPTSPDWSQLLAGLDKL